MSMSIKIKNRPDGSIEVECGGQVVIIQMFPPPSGGTETEPYEGGTVGAPGAVDPYASGSPGAMLTVPIDMDRLFTSGRPISKAAAFAQPGGTVRMMLEELAPRRTAQAHLLLRLARGGTLDLGKFESLVEALKAEGIALKIVTEN
jgi:hypothetical protein